jgi:hypothetical protein
MYALDKTAMKPSLQGWIGMCEGRYTLSILIATTNTVSQARSHDRRTDSRISTRRARQQNSLRAYKPTPRQLIMGQNPPPSHPIPRRPLSTYHPCNNLPRRKAICHLHFTEQINRRIVHTQKLHLPARAPGQTCR